MEGQKQDRKESGRCCVQAPSELEHKQEIHATKSRLQQTNHQDVCPTDAIDPAQDMWIKRSKEIGIGEIPSICRQGHGPEVVEGGIKVRHTKDEIVTRYQDGGNS